MLASGKRQEPWFWGRMPLVGSALNVIYNMKQQRLSYASVGKFLSNHLGPGEELRGKRVGLLEDASKLKHPSTYTWRVHLS